MKAILLEGSTSMQSLPVRTTGQDFLHSCRHFLGLHLSLLTMAILRRWSGQDRCAEIDCRLEQGKNEAHRVNLSPMMAVAVSRLEGLNEQCESKQQAFD